MGRRGMVCVQCSLHPTCLLLESALDHDQASGPVGADDTSAFIRIAMRGMRWAKNFRARAYDAVSFRRVLERELCCPTCRESDRANLAVRRHDSVARFHELLLRRADMASGRRQGFRRVCPDRTTDSSRRSYLSSLAVEPGTRQRARHDSRIGARVDGAAATDHRAVTIHTPASVVFRRNSGLVCDGLVGYQFGMAMPRSRHCLPPVFIH